MGCSEIALSIVHDRYWNHEPLFAIPDGDDFLVIEGNRRVAAIKALLDPKLLVEVAGAEFPRPSVEVIESMRQLPVVVVDDRMTVWKFIGFKHVNGPARWGSYAKAQYIASVSDSGIPLTEIASQIGDTNRTVQRLYRAYMVIRQAEAERLWKREYAFKRQLSFSHLMTGLDYDGIAEFLSVADKSDEQPNPVPHDRLQNLKQLCEWLWGDSRSNTPPIIRSQNPDLRNLNQVLLNSVATKRLQLDGQLDQALQDAYGDPVVFANSLAEARAALSRAQGKVTEGFHGEALLLEEAWQVARMGVDLYQTMKLRVEGIDDLRARLGQ